LKTIINFVKNVVADTQLKTLAIVGTQQKDAKKLHIGKIGRYFIITYIFYIYLVRITYTFSNSFVGEECIKTLK